jgi:hypothetical protein
MLKVRLIAPVSELVAEPGIREGAILVIHKESEIAASRAV